MNRKGLAGLVAVNIALLMVLGVLCLTPQRASAQLGGARGDYFMVAGAATGQSAGVLWIVDAVSAKVILVGYDKRVKQLSPIAGRDIAQDAQGGGR